MSVFSFFVFLSFGKRFPGTHSSQPGSVLHHTSNRTKGIPRMLDRLILFPSPRRRTEPISCLRSKERLGLTRLLENRSRGRGAKAVWDMTRDNKHIETSRSTCMIYMTDGQVGLDSGPVREFGLTESLLGHFCKRIHRRTIFFPECFLSLLDLCRPLSPLCGLFLLPLEPVCVPLGDSEVV